MFCNSRIRAISLILILLLSIGMIARAGSHVHTATTPASNFQRIAGKTGSAMIFRTADIAVDNSATIPAAGWTRHALPSFHWLRTARERSVMPPTIWVRVRFDRQVFGTTPLALNVQMIRTHFNLYVNGIELYRSRATPADDSLGWNHPLFVPLPSSMLRASTNEVVFRIETASPQLLGIGDILIGPDSHIRTHYNAQFFVTNIAPQIITGYIVMLTVGALLFWVKRPDDTVLAWFALVGIVWSFRNLHYFLQAAPFDPAVFFTLTTDSIFVLMSVVFCFAINYYGLRHARALYLAIAAFCIFEIAFRHFLIDQGRDGLLSFLLTIPVLLSMLVLVGRSCLRNPNFQSWSMFIALCVTVVFSLHDMVFSFNILGGAGLYLQPYGGLLIFCAFDAALTNRLQNALIDVEDSNLQLEARVAAVTRSLVDSEAARAQLQVSHAVDGERERIMREIHDGIGSSLITALANARHRHDSPETIATLSRSLTDLRIGVDSLEPIGGDVVALLANLRHRMERELKGAGFTFIWNVEAAPPLTWLDPIGALHILRILQEAIGNVLLHSDATAVEVRCGPTLSPPTLPPSNAFSGTRGPDNPALLSHNSVSGVTIEISDRGGGFDKSDLSRGKGLRNMAARAEAIGVSLTCVSKIGEGTTVSLWLPFIRDAIERGTGETARHAS